MIVKQIQRFTSFKEQFEGFREYTGCGLMEIYLYLV